VSDSEELVVVTHRGGMEEWGSLEWVTLW